MVSPSRRKQAVSLVVALTAALALVASALAERPAIRYTADGQAAARAVVVKRGDLSSDGWLGGALKPKLSADLGCGSFKPKQADLVVVGAARTEWTKDTLWIDSASQVMRTPQMAQLDWQRSVLSPQLLPCLRKSVSRQVGGSGRLVSLRKLSFPQVATYTAAYRVVIDAPAYGSTVRMFFDLVAFGRGRTEITLGTIAPLSSAKAVTQTELRLARKLAARIRA